MKPEHRLKVIDLSTHFSGSVASRYLAHLGADIVKFENPSFGDGNRGMPPLIHGEAAVSVALNAAKRSVTIDRRSSEWTGILAASAKWADVILLGSPPDTARKRGLDFNSFVALNDRIVYCNISSYGENGPWRDYPLHGLNGDIVAGLVPVEMVNGLPQPREEYRSVGTTLAGIQAALGILEAVRRRDLGYGPQRVLASVWEAAMSWQWRDMTTWANIDRPNPAYSDLGSRYAMYETSDDRVILLCPIEKKFWEPFCDLLKLPPEWKTVGSWTQSGMDWGEGRQDEREAIAGRIREHTFTHWNAVFEKAGIPCSPVYHIREAMETAQAKVMGVMADTTVNGKPARVPNVPIHIATAAAAKAAPHGPQTVPSPPRLGEHTEAFLREIGWASPREARL